MDSCDAQKMKLNLKTNLIKLEEHYNVNDQTNYVWIDVRSNFNNVYKSQNMHRSVYKATTIFNKSYCSNSFNMYNLPH